MTDNISPLMQFAHDDAEIIKVHRLFEQAHLPVYATQQSACFDFRASLRQGDLINIFSRNHLPHTTSVTKDLSFSLNRGERCLVPTGLIFDLKHNQSLRIHPRSGLAWKNAVTVINCEGIVDADYTDQSFVMLYNAGNTPFVIQDGMRIGQGEIVKMPSQYKFSQIEHKPDQKTDRDGGFGSTGVH